MRFTFGILCTVIICSYSYSQTEETPIPKNIYEAAAAGDVERFLQFLPDVQDINLQDSKGMNPLHYAAQNGHIKILDILLADPKLNLNETTSNHRLALHLSIDYNQVDFAVHLLEAGAYPYIKFNRETLLHDAIVLQHLPLIEVILKLKPALIKNISNSNETVFHYAAQFGTGETMALLLNTGNSPTIISKEEFLKLLNTQEHENQRTALHLAVENNKPDPVKMLLEAGADKSIRDKFGKTPGNLAVNLKLDPIMGLLGEAYGTGYPLLDATLANDVEQVRKILANDPTQINCQTDGGWTALNIASYHGYKDIFDCLLNYNPDVNLAINLGQSPLHSAAISGHISIVEKLIKSGANLESRNSTGATPFTFAILRNHLEIAKLLHDHGTDADTIDNRYRSPLYIAAGKGATETVQLLISMKADVNRLCEIDRDGKNAKNTPLINAACYPSLETVKILIEAGADLSIRNWKDATALYYAISRGQEEMATYLLDHGAKVQCWFNHGSYTPLHLAVTVGQVEIAKLLLKRGADTNASKYGGGTPIDHAIKEENPEMVQLLLDHGVKVSPEKAKETLQDYLRASGSTFTDDQRKVLDIISGGKPHLDSEDLNRFMLSAVTGDQFETAKLFIEQGADVNYQEEPDDDTALHIAAGRNQRALVTLLLEHGADINAKGFTGATPIFHAATPTMANLLIEHGADIHAKNKYGESVLHEQAPLVHRNMAVFYLEKGIDPNIRDDRGETPLHHLVRKCASPPFYEKGVQVLVEHGADVNAKDNLGYTPLMQALNFPVGNREKALLEAGADPTLTNNKGQSPMFGCARNGNIEQAEKFVKIGLRINIADASGITPLHLAKGQDMIQFLVDHGADINARDEEGKTPLYTAIERDRDQEAFYLLQKGANPLIPDSKGKTLVHLVARKDNPELLSTVLEKGGDPNATISSSWYPINSLLDRRKYSDAVVPMIKILASHGCRFDVPMHQSKTVLAWVVSERRRKEKVYQNNKTRHLQIPIMGNMPNPLDDINTMKQVEKCLRELGAPE